MTLPRARVAAVGPLSLPIVIVVLYTGLVALALLELRYLIDAQPAFVIYLRLEQPAWPFDPLRRALGGVSGLLIAWLWTCYRSHAGRGGGWDAVPYLGASLLLVYLQVAIARGLAAPPLSGTLERILP